MKISDIIVESTTEQLEQLKKEYFADKGTYNNASHKFFSIRKKLSNSDSSFSTVTPAEFFSFIKSGSAAQSPKSEANPHHQKFVKLFGKEPTDKTITDLTKFPNGTTRALSKLVSIFRADTSADSATKKFYKAYNSLLINEDWFGEVAGITAELFFNHLKNNKLPQRRSSWWHSTSQQDDGGDWDDKMHIDQVERTIKRWRKGF